MVLFHRADPGVDPVHRGIRACVARDVRRRWRRRRRRRWRRRRRRLIVENQQEVGLPFGAWVILPVAGKVWRSMEAGNAVVDVALPDVGILPHDTLYIFGQCFYIAFPHGSPTEKSIAVRRRGFQRSGYAPVVGTDRQAEVGEKWLVGGSVVADLGRRAGRPYVGEVPIDVIPHGLGDVVRLTVLTVEGQPVAGGDV